MGACEYQTSVATTPIVHSHLPVTVSASVRSAQVIDSVHAVHDSAQLGIKPFPIASSGMDQSRVAGSGAIDSSAPSALSPSSVLFPLPDYGVSSLPGPSSSSLSSASVSTFPSGSSLSSATPLPPSHFPSFAPSLFSASFPSSPCVTRIPHLTTGFRSNNPADNRIRRRTRIPIWLTLQIYNFTL